MSTELPEIRCRVAVDDERGRLRRCGKEPIAPGYLTCADHFPEFEDAIRSSTPDAERFPSLDAFFDYIGGEA